MALFEMQCLMVHERLPRQTHKKWVPLNLGLSQQGAIKDVRYPAAEVLKCPFRAVPARPEQIQGLGLLRQGAELPHIQNLLVENALDVDNLLNGGFTKKQLTDNAIQWPTAAASLTSIDDRSRCIADLPSQSLCTSSPQIATNC